MKYILILSCYYSLNKCLPIVGSPYWMAPECIMGYKYSEKVNILLCLNCSNILHYIVKLAYNSKVSYPIRRYYVCYFELLNEW